MADLVRSDIEAYAAAHTTPLPAALQRLHDEATRELPYPSMLSGPVVARLLQTLVAAARPRLVVEVGTYAGFSALAMAEALPPEGRIITLELDDRHADFAQRHVDASAYADRIEIVRGPALESLARLDGPFDLVFIDADKTGYPDYYEAALAKLAPDGLIVADNTLRGGDVLAPDSEGDEAIAALNDRWAGDPRVVATQLTVRDGVTILRRRQNA
ncbi:MAG TPA: O-methyltransferase [Baekduia sp.]|uniref:O-methyltransferase n=1 Tax=Baekduia sp. TaxID=2600305 RepID=UPI002D76D33C|nr:O-methyltransferase [Baekduia sp.]HET6508531.1 O-methyltransferase [Baekduia sp.]